MRRAADARAERLALGAIAALALLIGLWARLSHVDQKMFWNDETYTAIYVSGHGTAGLYALFDGHEHSLAEVRAYQRLAPGTPVARTLDALRSDDPHHSPLFYLLDRLGVGIFGDSIAGLRAVSVASSLAALACAFWLGVVLFRRRLGGVVVTALVAVGPFFLAYAHQAREYALLAAVVFAATAALVVAIGGGAVVAWVGYAMLVAIGMYVHPAFVLVIVAHALEAVLLLARSRPRRLIAFGIACVAGIATLAPFVLNAAASHAAIERDLEWGMSAYPLRYALAKFGFNLGALGFDAEFARLWLAPFAVLVAVAAVVAVVALAFRGDARVRAVVLPLALVPALVLAVRDALGGSHFVTIARYLTATWIGVDLALASWIVVGFASARPRVRLLAIAGFAAFVVLGSLSAVLDAPARNWWDNNDDVAFQDVAAVVNRDVRPLVLAPLDLPAVLSLSHYLRDDASFVLFRANAIPAVCLDARPTFLLVPSPEVLAAVERVGAGRYRVRNVSPVTVTAIAAFHRGLDSARPGVRASTLWRTTPTALWELEPERVAERFSTPDAEHRDTPCLPSRGASRR